MRDIDMSTKYDPTSVEAGRYDNWQSKKLFAPESNKEIQGNEPEPYSIVIPPPNAVSYTHLDVYKRQLVHYVVLFKKVIKKAVHSWPVKFLV